MGDVGQVKSRNVRANQWVPGRLLVWNRVLYTLLSALLSSACAGPTSNLGPTPPSDPEPLKLALGTVVTGLANPVDLQAPGDGSGRLFVLEQQGLIRIIQNGALVASPFLDIRGLVESGGEKGSLALAFH